jgi:hypothetical protein
MARWSRRSGTYLVKSRRIADGELLHLLTGNASDAITDLDTAAYASLLRVKTATSKSLIWVVGFNALGILAHFNVVKGASAAGLELAPTVFTHVSLAGASLTGAWFCFNYTKQTFLQAWFSWKFKVGSPAFKARCLILFPEAYWHFAYLPANIGYPRFHFARGSTWPQLFYLLLVLVALIVGAVGSIGLWVVLARDVLANSQITHTISVLTVVFSAATILLGWLSPFRYDVSRRYTHMGLVSLLGKREGERNAEAHRRLVRVADRMGLVKWPRGK